MSHRSFPIAWLLCALPAVSSPWCWAAEPAGVPASAGLAGKMDIRVRSFLPSDPLCRACRPARIEAVIENAGDVLAEVRPRLLLPDSIRMIGQGPGAAIAIDDADEKSVWWEIEADSPGPRDLRLQVCLGDTVGAAASLSILFLPPLEVHKQSYIPEPEPIETPILVGAHHCPLWEADKPGMWAQLLKHPERTPALGFYAQENPQVADWETKWAVEHGVSFFIYCWYRTSQGEPVKTQFSSAIHDALFKSRFVGKMKFTIMWENQSRGRAGVADETDLMTNLLPFWMDNYFRHPSYLKMDNKPLLFVYRPEFLVQDLGSVENVVRAFDRMRQACRDKGFDGLYILGEYRGLDPNHLKLMKQLGLDYTFAYCWYVANNPTPQRAIEEQMRQIGKTQELGIIPQVVTVSQAWSGWADEGTIWKIPPTDYATLLRRGKEFVATLPPGQLGGRMLLLDNWNEWGEGHYIAPYREYGFGYLDAVRDVLSRARRPHIDLIPADIGLGPYDTAYKAHAQQAEASRKLTSKKASKPGTATRGLIGWWAFDEEQDSPVALDYSGHRLGGSLRSAGRAKGIDGNALVCRGGCVLVENHRLLSPAAALTLECWVRTDMAGQDNRWFINRVFGGGIDTGYRLGVLEGRPCFEVPVTPWSHHLKADAALPTGRWVHLAGTFDGKTMSIYVDGQEHGRMDRPGPVKANAFHLCLGSYELNHASHFTGLLDEVRIYDRALTADEIREHYRTLAVRAR
jgi:hypothetical protein